MPGGPDRPEKGQGRGLVKSLEQIREGNRAPSHLQKISALILALTLALTECAQT